MKEETPKLCSRCGKNPRLPYQRWCRECHREYSRIYRREHLEECRAAVRRWYANLTPETKKAVLRRIKERRAQRMADPASAEAFRKHAAEYYQQHKDKLLAYQARYWQEHAKKRKEKRRAKNVKSSVPKVPQKSQDHPQVGKGHGDCPGD